MNRHNLKSIQLTHTPRFLSTLYCHSSFPQDEDAANKCFQELRKTVTKHWQVYLSPPWSPRYLKKIASKAVSGQPVSFTDFFGYLVAQHLIGKVCPYACNSMPPEHNQGRFRDHRFAQQKMTSTLSDQREKIRDGAAPLPVHTCLHVKSNVSAKIFQEWYEFTPFEVSIPKYGVCMKMEDFGSKFYMGQKVKGFQEFPLHFLYGLWGSAFSILLKRLVQERRRNSHTEILRLILSNGHCSPGQTFDALANGAPISRCA